MTWAKSGSTISQTGTESGYAGAVTAGYMSYVGDSALKVVQIATANDLLNINGTFDDSGWTVIYKSTSASSGGSRFLAGSSAVWTSGSEIDGVPVGGSVHIIQNTGISWGVNSQLTTGCQLNWFGLKIIVKGDGFLQLLDNAAASNTHVLKGLTIDASGSTYRWQMVNVKNSADSYADLVGVDFTTKGLGAFPSIRSWRASASGDISVLPDDAAQSGGVGSTNTFVGLAVNFLTAAQRLKLSNHGGKIATYRLENSFISPARVTLSSNPNNNATSHARWFSTIAAKAVDLSGVAIADATVIIKNLSVVKASGTTSATGDFLSALIETYYATVSNGSANVGLDTLTPTVTDGRALDVRIRKAGFVEQTYANNSNIAGKIAKTFALSADADFTGTAAQAAAITGVAFAHNSVAGTVAVSVTGAVTAQQMYNHWSHWTAQSAQMGATLVPTGLIVVNAGVLTITGTLTTDSVISGGGNVLAIKTTGAITLSSGGAIALPFEDSAGVRVTVTKQGGGNFNILARHRSGSGTYTSLGYSSGVSTVTYTVPRGNDVEIVIWALGCVTYSRTLNTANGGLSFAAEMTINPTINTTLDVSSYLADISLSLDTSGATPKFVITFNAPVVVAGIELGKAIIHRLAGYQVALAAGLPPGGTSAIAINADEITNNLPSVRLDLGSSLTVTDRAYLDFFINTTPALVVDSTYVINPPRADGNQVQILRAKPALDASILAAQAAAAVRTELAVELGRIDVSTSTRLSAIGYAAPTLAQIEASTVLAKESTLSALATVNQAEHDATQAAIAAIPPVNLAPVLTAVDTLPTLAEMEGSWKLTNGGLIDLGVFTNYEGSAQTPYNAYFATFPKRPGLSSGVGLTARLFSAQRGFTGSVPVEDSEFNSNQLVVNIQNTADYGSDLDSAPTLIIFNGTTVNSPIVAKGVFIPGGPTMRDLEQSTTLAKKADLTVINNGVKKASLLIPHSTDLS